MKNLIKITVLLLAIVFVSSCFGKNNNETKAIDYRLEYQEYIDLYGIDDTSIAIIEMYFAIRDISGKGKMSFLPLSSSLIVVMPPLGIGLSVISTPIFVSGMLTSIKYSRKNLHKSLYEYHNFHNISKNTRNKIGIYIQVKNETQEKEITENNLDKLKSIYAENKL